MGRTLSQPRHRTARLVSNHWAFRRLCPASTGPWCGKHCVGKDSHDAAPSTSARAGGQSWHAGGPGAPAPAVKGVTALEGYVVRVLFEDGEIRDVDVEPLLDGPILQPLRERAFFETVPSMSWATRSCWPNGVDLDPEVLYGLERLEGEPAPGVITRALVSVQADA